MKVFRLEYLVIFLVTGFDGVNSEASSTITETFVYDWSAASASVKGIVLDDDRVAGDNNDGWTNIGGLSNGSDDIVRSAGQPSADYVGNYFSFDPVAFNESLRAGTGPDDFYNRPNDSNFSYSIPASALTVELSFILQANRDVGAARFGPEGGSFLGFGIYGSSEGRNDGDWGVRGTDLTVFERNGVAAARLDNTLRVYRANLIIDMTTVGSAKEVDLIVEKLTDGGEEIIYTDLPVEFGNLADPSLWNSMYLRAARTSIDDLTISYTIPEPATISLIGLCGVSIVGLRPYCKRTR